MTSNIRVPAKKSLGQHWLINEGVCDRIIDAADITPNETVVEVGPGTGALTRHLVNTGARIIAIEKDHRLIESLRQQFPTIELIEGDVRTIHPDCDAVVANIPYYLTSHLVRLITEQWRPSVAVLMVQYEVAHRMMAAPPNMNVLALSVQLYAQPELIMRVSRGSFRPMPEVDSAVIRLIPIPCDRAHNERILALAKKAFGQKRKQLKATIPEAVLLQTGIDPKTRPQELSVDNWNHLVK